MKVRQLYIFISVYTTLLKYYCRNYTLQGKEQETGLILVVHLPIILPIILSLSLFGGLDGNLWTFFS